MLRQRRLHFLQIQAQLLRLNHKLFQFFLQQLTRRIAPSGPQSPELRVVIVLSPPMAFPQGVDRTPIETPSGTDYRVFYIRYQTFIGPPPDVRTSDGTVTMRYRRRVVDTRSREIDAVLHPAAAWAIEVENGITGLGSLDRAVTQADASVKSAQDAFDIATARYKGGVDTYLQVITAQTTALNNERNDIDILRRRMDSTVNLIMALGGGWDRPQLPPQ